MKRFESIRNRLERLENRELQGRMKVTIEKHGDTELVRWGKNLIVKILRGCSTDDL